LMPDTFPVRTILSTWSGNGLASRMFQQLQAALCHPSMCAASFYSERA
jgi:hypothetical protein